MLENTGQKTVSEQCFTSPPTQYRLYGRRFLQVKRPNQQYQSTEGRSTKDKLNIQTIQKLNTTQKKQTIQNKINYLTLSQETRWAHFTTLPSPQSFKDGIHLTHLTIVDKNAVV